LPNGAGSLRVIAGSYQELVGPASTFTPLNLWDVELEGEAVFEVPFGYNLAIAVLDGQVVLNGSEAEGPSLVVFNQDGDGFKIASSGKAHLLILSGEPIKEPMFAHGPFVMNTYQEISQAINDYQAGKMGRLS
jgi:redox-sensitive bicupin YhaK (pirin superfamily)